MRSVWIVAMITSLALSGCAEGGIPAEPVQETDAAPVETLLTFQVFLDAPVNASAAMPFNVTFGSDLADNLSANATWILEVYNGTAPAAASDDGDAPQGNATAPEGNATGNATAPEGNATVDGNATAGNVTEVPMVAPVHTASGTGASGTIPLNLTTVGNHTMRLIVSLEGHEDAMAEAMTLIEGTTVVAIPDPPEPFVFEGTVSGTLPNAGLSSCSTDDTTYEFEVEHPWDALRFTMDADDSTTGADLDWSIKGPGGESHSSEAIGNEAPKNFASPTPGTWSVTVVCYTSFGSNDYTITATIS